MGMVVKNGGAAPMFSVRYSSYSTTPRRSLFVAPAVFRDSGFTGLGAGEYSMADFEPGPSRQSCLGPSCRRFDFVQRYFCALSDWISRG